MGIGNFFNNLFGRQRAPLDISIFNHPLCEKTSWEPLIRGGNNYRTHHLKSDEQGNLVFKLRWATYLTVLLPITFVIFLDLGSSHFGTFSYNNQLRYILYLAPIAFAASLGYRHFKTIRFDFANGVYWKGYRSPVNADNPEQLKNWAHLQDIGGLQIIRERVRANKSRYTSYELNLVLKNGDRLNVVDHGSLARLRDDAQQLAQRLQVPLWDAGDY